ncbi:palmitoyl-protein thioesterase 1-like [Macrosteles quadrilineatus]|uniref:palmitoyl-protein thioesterase 1-like n=1 Tax=Macrosteles quadrilineatus TaxID=74068 RepID=UPI0023E22CCF|nr:palmitoyl-protein thioesterase 1-like [Macrosteles quadrilineatus]
MACKMIAEDKKLQRGYHAVGFGEGGLYLRAVAQKCSDPPIFNLITLGTQHQGKFGKAEDDKFLADINNEDKNNPNELYRTNLIKLKNLVLYRFQFDSQIDPPESSWFGFYGKDYELRSMVDSELYKEDRIGLKTLNEGNRIHTIEGMGVHLQVLENLFMKSIVKPYLTENYWVDTDKKSPS